MLCLLNIPEYENETLTAAQTISKDILKVNTEQHIKYRLNTNKILYVLNIMFYTR